MSTPDDACLRPGIRRNRQIAERYVAGASLESLGAQYGVTRWRVRQVLIGMGVPLRGRGRPQKRKRITHQGIEIPLNGA